MITFADMLAHLATQLNTVLAGALEAKAQTAVYNGWSRLLSMRAWNYFARLGGLNLSLKQAEGTVGFTASTRTLTLQGAVWPVDIQTWHVKIDGTWFPVYKRLSDTQVLLVSGQHPPSDLTNVSYVAQQVLYPLPSNVGDVAQIVESRNDWVMRRLDLLTTQRLQDGFNWSPVVPNVYSLVASPQFPGRWCLWIPTEVNNESVLRYMYQQRVPERFVVLEKTGTASVNNGVVTFSSAVAAEEWVGCVLRLSKDTNQPSGMFGEISTGDVRFNRSPEYLITAYLSPTSVEIGETGVSRTAVAYNVSSHIDVAEGAMSVLLQKLIESEMGARPVGDQSELLVSQRRIQQATIDAMTADARLAPSMRPELREWMRYRLGDFGTVRRT